MNGFPVWKEEDACHLCLFSLANELVKSTFDEYIHRILGGNVMDAIEYFRECIKAWIEEGFNVATSFEIFEAQVYIQPMTHKRLHLTFHDSRAVGLNVVSHTNGPSRCDAQILALLVKVYQYC